MPDPRELPGPLTEFLRGLAEAQDLLLAVLVSYRTGENPAVHVHAPISAMHLVPMALRRAAEDIEKLVKERGYPADPEVH